MANDDYAPINAEQWRDSSAGNSFSDERYRATRTLAQRQEAIDWRNAEVAH